MKSLSAQGRAWFQIGAAITTRSAAARRSQTATTPSHAAVSSLGTGAPPMTAIFALGLARGERRDVGERVEPVDLGVGVPGDEGLDDAVGEGEGVGVAGAGGAADDEDAGGGGGDGHKGVS